MRCKSCDYSLWNITARKCPECGTDFKPSDFHFVPNSVRYLCPHCEQDYYGTTQDGHLIPRTFHCVKCSQRIDMDEMLLLPTAGVEESRTAADIMPWLQRRQVGLFKGWIKTVGMSLVAPHRLVRAIPGEVQGGAGQSIMFALFTNSLMMGLGIGLPLAAIAMIMFFNRDPSALEMLGTSALAFALGGVGMTLLAMAWGLLTHGLLRISGPLRRGLGATMQAMCYSSGTNITMSIPCVGWYCGGYFLWIWWMVSAIIMVIELQKVGGLRATLCVGAGPLLGVLATVAWFVWIFYTISAMAGGAGGMGGPFGAAIRTGYVPMREATSIRDGLVAFTAANGGRLPLHAVELVETGTLSAAEFAIVPIGHDEASVMLPVALSTLDAFQYLPRNRMKLAAQAEAAGLPANAIAHRMGDVVLVHHGNALLNSLDPTLWIAVISPDPDQSGVSILPAGAGAGTGPAAGSVTQSMSQIAIAADGQFIVIPPGSLPPLLAEQNARRAANNLAPLPDLATIRNSVPAVGP